VVGPVRRRSCRSPLGADSVRGPAPSAPARCAEPARLGTVGTNSGRGALRSRGARGLTRTGKICRLCPISTPRFRSGWLSMPGSIVTRAPRGDSRQAASRPRVARCVAGRRRCRGTGAALGSTPQFDMAAFVEHNHDVRGRDLERHQRAGDASIEPLLGRGRAVREHRDLDQRVATRMPSRIRKPEPLARVLHEPHRGILRRCPHASLSARATAARIARFSSALRPCNVSIRAP
jgi:hypothetical protein